MKEVLRVAVGQWSDRGRKDVQQDFHGACVPPATSSLLDEKGVAVALADGISSSPISHEASQYAIGSFLADYYSTPDAWSVKTSVERVVDATNAWLLAQTRRRADGYDQDSGCVCTFTALVVKRRAAHVFHVGDARVHRVASRDLEVLTTDHRVHVGAGQSYLGRALGVGPLVDIDYRTMPVAVGDTFVLTTDGVHEHVDGRFVADAIARSAGDLDAAAHSIVDEAMARGSDDNLTVQIVRIDALPAQRADELAQSSKRASRRTTTRSSARSSTPRPSTSPAKPGPGAQTSTRSASWHTRCCRGACRTGPTRRASAVAQRRRSYATDRCSISIARFRPGSTRCCRRQSIRIRSSATRRCRNSSTTCAILPTLPARCVARR